MLVGAYFVLSEYSCIIGVYPILLMLSMVPLVIVFMIIIFV